VPGVAADGADILKAVEVAYRLHFHVAPVRACISFLGVDPIEVLRYSEGLQQHYVSLGMSRYAMSDPGSEVVDPVAAPRGELMVTSIGPADEIWRNLAVLAAAPAVEGVVYVVGHRVDLGEPLVPGSRCTGGVLVAAELRPITVGGAAPVTVLRLLPATSHELAWARVHGTAALQKRGLDAGIEVADMMRKPVDLT
jgi:hypothetical protein